MINRKNSPQMFLNLATALPSLNKNPSSGSSDSRKNDNVGNRTTRSLNTTSQGDGGDDDDD